MVGAALPRPVGDGRRALRGYGGRTETPPQNTQRVLLGKPRTAVANRHGVRMVRTATEPRNGTA